VEGNSINLYPPAVALFDQISEWRLMPAAPSGPTRPDLQIIGIRAAALCMRWGTYLAVLLDESKPLNPRTQLPEFSK
jgi:hypothetical protein